MVYGNVSENDCAKRRFVTVFGPLCANAMRMYVEDMCGGVLHTVAITCAKESAYSYLAQFGKKYNLTKLGIVICRIYAHMKLFFSK